VWKENKLMASTTVVHLIDDIDGSDAARTVEFGVDGVSYTIDLSTAHMKELEDALAVYVARARRVVGHGRVSRVVPTRTSRGSAAASARAAKDRNTQIREWASATGQQLADRGRIPQSVVEEYEAAQSQPAVQPAPELTEAAAPVKPTRGRKPPAATFSGGGE